MNYHEINQYATEIVNSYASMETDTKWDQFLRMQVELAASPVEQLLSNPEYIAAIFVGHVRFNDGSYIKKLRDSIEWPENCLDDYLEMMSAKRVASIAESKLPKWQEIKTNYPSHATMVIFITHSLANNPLTKTFLNNLKQ